MEFNRLNIMANKLFPLPPFIRLTDWLTQREWRKILTKSFQDFSASSLLLISSLLDKRQNLLQYAILYPIPLYFIIRC